MPGAAIGGTLGAALGGIKGISGVVDDPLKRSLAFSMMPGAIGETFKEQYDVLKANQFVDFVSKSREGLIDQDPFRKMATEKYQKDYLRDLDVQRQLGLNFQTFHGRGGFRERAINAGFSDEMAMGMSNSIMGAGGSTRMGAGSAFGLMLQRGANLTNAGQVLGTLSGGLGGARETKEATIKILAEGVKLGLDNSQYAEENRKFVQTTAEIISRSGAKSNVDIDRVISNFSKFATDPTMKGLESAKTAYETYQQSVGAMSGPQGAIRAAGFIRDDVLGKLSAMDRAGLAGIKPEEISEDHPLIRNAANKAGVDPSEIIRRVRKIGESAVHRLARGDVLEQRVRGQRKTLESGEGRLGPQRLKSLQSSIQAGQDELAAILAVENPSLGKES